MSTITPVKCGSCKGWHDNARAVRECYFPASRSITPATMEQRRNIAPSNHEEKSMNQWNVPNRRQTKIPLGFLESLRDGYYATRLSSDDEYTFFRVSRPKIGRYQNHIKIQTQHGPDYELMMVVYPDKSVIVYDFKVEDELMLVCVTPYESNIAYAAKIGKCMRCNTELTDARSRHYGIGPECEKHWPWIIEAVEDRKGPFVPGNDE